MLTLFVQFNPPAWGNAHTDFRIHGLWPEYSNGSWPEYCCKQSSCAYNETFIADLQPNLTMWWTDFHNPQKLWRHEWEKHGTCSGLNEHDYFTTGLAWRDKYPMYRVLRGSMLEPHTTYPLEFFIDQLSKFLRARPSLVCKGKLLEQVYLCLWNGTLGDCPVVIKSKCPGYLHY